MSSLRVLGISYLATASLFSLAIAYSDHAALRMVTDDAARAISSEFQTRVMTPLLQFARLQDEKLLDPQARVQLAPPGPNDARDLARVDLPLMPEKNVQPQELGQTFVVLPDMPDLPAMEKEAAAPPPMPKLAQAQPAKIPALARDNALGAVERAALTARLEQKLTPEMIRNFDVFLYVSKAKAGPMAQRLYVFKKDAGGALKLEYDWVVSTGREIMETSPRGVRGRSSTPAGFYQFDARRMYRNYHSRSWDQPMPFAMFFNWENRGIQTGLAIHSATGDDIARLGQRSSAGCVHLSPENAKELFEMVRAGHKGKTPRFAYDSKTSTMSNKGELMRDASGNLVMADGYRVLVNIEDFDGADMLAALD